MQQIETTVGKDYLFFPETDSCQMWLYAFEINNFCV